MDKEGEFKDGLSHGTKTSPEGEKYVGEFKDSKYHGHGTITYEKGDKMGEKYKGEFKNGYPDGHGTMTLPEGHKYEGNWEKGYPNGSGTETLIDGTIYQGEYKELSGMEYIKIKMEILFQKLQKVYYLNNKTSSSPSNRKDLPRS